MMYRTLQALDGQARAYERELASPTCDDGERLRVRHELACVRRARELLRSRASAEDVEAALRGD